MALVVPPAAQISPPPYSLGDSSPPHISSPGYFGGAHNFSILNAIFNDNSCSNSAKVDELRLLRIDLKKTVIENATYDDLSGQRRAQFRKFKVPEDVQQKCFQNSETPIEHYFLTSSDKDILSVTGVPIVQLFRDNAITGVKLVAHILFYDIPITQESYFINIRPNVSQSWVTTLAYQLMLTIPDVAIPMLEVLHLDPELPCSSSEEQLRKLIVNPLRSLPVEKDSKLSCDETLIILLDCIDCSTDAPSMALDIAFLVKELQFIDNLKLRLVVTGLPDQKVLYTLRQVSVKILELPPPQTPSLPFKSPNKRYGYSMHVLLAIEFGFLAAAGCLTKIDRNLTVLLIGLSAYAAITEVLVLGTFLMLKSIRPWDVHGREGAVKTAIQVKVMKTLMQVLIIILSAAVIAASNTCTTDNNERKKDIAAADEQPQTSDSKSPVTSEQEKEKQPTSGPDESQKSLECEQEATKRLSCISEAPMTSY